VIGVVVGLSAWVLLLGIAHWWIGRKRRALLDGIGKLSNTWLNEQTGRRDG